MAEIIGTSKKDKLVGTSGDDTLDGMGAADKLTGGAGADTFKIHSWAFSIDKGGERDEITDFEPNDKIDLANVSHYALNADRTRTVRDLTIEDITFEPIHGGNILHISVWEGDAQFDVGIKVMGFKPEIGNFIFNRDE